MSDNFEVVYVKNNNEEIPAIIVACELNVGATLMNTKNEFILCVNGPLSTADYMKGITQTEKITNCVNQVIQYILDCIKDGNHIFETDIDEIIERAGYLASYNQASDSTCAFHN